MARAGLGFHFSTSSQIAERGTLARMTTISSPDGIKKPGKSGGSGHRLFDSILILLLIGAFAFIAYTEWQRQQTAQELTVTTQKLEDFKKNPQKSGDEVAKSVLDKLRKHMVFAEDPAPTVATIVNAEELRKENSEFYARASNGNNLIITKDRAILFDAQAENGNGKILDVVPVQIQSPSPTPVGASPTPTTSPAAPTTSPVVSPTPSPVR